MYEPMVWPWLRDLRKAAAECDVRSPYTDRGTDMIIVSAKDWPTSWPLVNTSDALAEIEETAVAQQSTMYIQVVNPEGQTATTCLCFHSTY